MVVCCKLLYWVLLCGVVVAVAGSRHRRTTVDRNDSEPAVVRDWQNDFGWEAPHVDLQYKKEDKGQRRTQANLDYSRDGVYQPLRIRFLTDPIETRRGESDAIDAEIDSILQEILPAAAATWADHLSVVPVDDVIRVTENNCFLRSSGLSYNRPFEDADLVIVVGGDDFLLANGEPSQVCFDTTLALASPCILDQFDRPIVGFMNFCLGRQQRSPIQASIQDAFAQHIGVTLRNTHLENNMLEIAVHEMGHILGQASWLFKYFRDENGDPMTARPFRRSEGLCQDGTVANERFPSTNTVQLMPNSAGGQSYMMMTPRVQQVVRNHFNCQDLPGARLEDFNGCIGTHWHERDFYGELMGPAYTSSSENLLSPLTLALMDDTGWYQVDYRGSLAQSFGLGAGCEFVSEPCIIDDEVPSWGVGSFCSNEFRVSRGGIESTSLNSVLCDPGHRSWALCDLMDEATLTGDVDYIRRYFSDPSLVATFPGADSCPIPDFGLGLDCTRDDDYVAYFQNLESVGESSRCINAVYSTERGDTAYSPACMQIQCDAEARVVRIGPTSAELVCEFDGQKIEVPGYPGEFLECPLLRVVCPDVFACPASCSGRGVCNYDGPIAVCECFDNDLGGGGCYQPLGKPTPPPTSQPTNTPFVAPSDRPTFVPTTVSPSSNPTMPTSSPTSTPSPTGIVSGLPSISPTSSSMPSDEIAAFTPTRAPMFSGLSPLVSASAPIPFVVPCLLSTLLVSLLY